MSMRPLSWGRVLFVAMICIGCQRCSGEPNTSAPSGPGTVTTSASVIESVRSALDGITAYEARLVTHVHSSAMFRGFELPSFSVDTHAHLKVRPPAVSVSLRIVPDDPAMRRDDPPMVVLFDGETIWTGVTRFDQARLARSSRPLDSRMQVQGSGLLPKKDLVETIRSFLEDYTFASEATPHETEDGLVTRLVGEITVERLIDHVMTDADLVAGLAASMGSRASLIDMTAASIVAMRHLEVSIDAESSLPRSWKFGREGAITTEVVHFDPAAVFDDSTFEVPEAQRAGAVDQTEAYLEQLGRHPAPSAEGLQELREALREATQRLIADANVDEGAATP